jgi:hypothetical protein
VVVRKHAATAVREVAKHSPELAQLIVSCGGVGALVDYTASAEGNMRLPGIMALGYIAAFSETLALGVIASKGVPPLVAGLAAVSGFALECLTGVSQFIILLKGTFQEQLSRLTASC